MRTGQWRYTLCLTLLLSAVGGAFGATSSSPTRASGAAANAGASVTGPLWDSATTRALPPPVVANEYLREAITAAGQIGLGGDQSAARREIAIALSKFDGSAAQSVAAGISRPSDAARALAAVCVALAAKDPAAAQQVVATASRLLQRIAEPERRKEEERLFLGEVAGLGEKAVGMVAEIPTRESQEIVVTALAPTRPAEALRLLNLWQPPGTRSDAVLAALAPPLAVVDGAQATELAASIVAPERREVTLWRVAEERPAPEAVVLTSRVLDPVVRSGILASAARRGAAGDPGSAAAQVGIEVAPVSAKAEAAVDLARSNEAAAGEMARSLPDLARTWALNRIAWALAAVQPERAEAYLQEAGNDPEAVRLTAGSMATTDLERALRLARALPAGEARDAALAGVISALAATNATRAADLVAEVGEGPWRQAAVEATARQLARTDADAATSLLGLVADSDAVLPLRARTAVEVARRDPALATRLLATLPATFYRSEAAFGAAEAYLSTSGKPEAALRLAAIGLDPALAGRWLLAQVARNANESVSTLADAISSPYWRTLALVDAGRLSLRAPVARPALARTRMIRPIIEWEGI